MKKLKNIGKRKEYKQLTGNEEKEFNSQEKR